MLSKSSIAIVGAGTAGLATAIFLARAGIEVDLFEAVERTSPVGAGILLQPQGIYVLQKLGILPQILAAGARIDSLVGATKSGRLVMDFNYADLHPQLFGLGIHRGNLFEILIKQAQNSGVNFYFNNSVDGIQQDHQQAQLITEQGVSKSYSMIIIANGNWSKLTAKLNINRKHTPYPWGALWKIFDDPNFEFSKLLSQKYHQAKTMIGMLPTGINPLTGKNCVSFFWSLKSSDYEQWKTTKIEHWQQQVIALWPQLETWIKLADSHQSYTFARYADTVLECWHDNRVVVIGDAAHAMSPQLGQGANMALTDAMVLADCIGSEQNTLDAVVNYSRQRHKHIRYYQWASRFLTPLFQSDSNVAAAFRDLTFPPMKYIPLAKKHALATLFGVKTSLMSAKPNINLDELAQHLEALSLD